ncbi:Cytochrome P450 734A1 [Nymphaea thermarum]|nr:Cytochrome P450 734A1 [Nymphaea thermarum]
MGEVFFLWVVVVLMGLGVGLVKAWAVVWWRPRMIEAHFGKQGVRGPPYRPFVGNVREMVSIMLHASSLPMPLSHNILPRVLSFYHHWKKIYGGTFLIWFGPTPRLAVADPELIREIFFSKSELYEKYESDPLVRQLEGNGLLSLKGEKCAAHRRIIAPTFHMENLKALIPAIGQAVVQMVEEWERDSPESDSGERDIDVSDRFQRLTGEVITRSLFGASSYEDGKEVFRLQSQQMTFAAESFNKVMLPGYRFLPTKLNALSRRLNRDVKKSLAELIQKKYAAIKQPGRKDPELSQEDDLLGRMIAASERSASPESGNGGAAGARFTADDIVEECKAFFFAGKQTTSNMLTWTTVLLAMHPDWQEAARAEVLQHCGSRAVPTKDSIHKLKTINMILNESLRLYPPAVAAIRRAKSDAMLGGYRIPAGTELLIPILAVHHDPRLWGNDATEFNPGRFADGVARAAKHPMAFLPFGLGPRTCVGQNLALLQAKIVLAVILQRFSFRLSPSYRHSPSVLMLLYPQHGAPISFKPLEPGHGGRRRSL